MSNIAKYTYSCTLALLLIILYHYGQLFLKIKPLSLLLLSRENEMIIVFCSLQSTVSKTLWLFGTRPLHFSAVRRSMEVHPCPEQFKQGGEVRPVVVLFGWLLAKSRHLHKYGELYHQHGVDVITVKLEVMEVTRLCSVNRSEQARVKKLGPVPERSLFSPCEREKRVRESPG